MSRKTTMGRAGVRLPAKRTFERELEVLESMGGEMPDSEGISKIKKALGKENNYLVSKAAKLAAEHDLKELLPDVLTAYDRFFTDAVKTDPQCWAKNALSKALVALDCRDPEIYLRGLRHTQEEPVWGGQSDTAGALRATCTHALAACDGLSNEALLDHLLIPLVDPDKTVRVEAARAIGQAGGICAELLLKLRILLRKEESEVLGACFSALLSMEQQNRPASITLIAEFLDDGEEAAAEAAYALAETHEQSALALLIARRTKGADTWFGTVLDNSIALTRLPEGIDYLLSAIEQDQRQAISALEAISRVYQSSEVREKVAAAVQAGKNERVQLAYRQFFPTDNAPA